MTTSFKVYKNNIPVISAHLLDPIYQKLGLTAPISTDHQGLHRLYQAWCHQVPFDNVQKMTALFNQKPGSLPGGKADDFFASWLEHGTGGTCWSTSNALFSLLTVIGFDARLISGSMLDMGKPNHGSVIVQLEDKEWLVDSSMLTNQPVALLRDKAQIKDDDPLVKVETDPVEDTLIIWFEFPTAPSLMPCRLLEDPVDLEYYLRHYENSRNSSPFNQKLYVRKNFPGEIRILQGNLKFIKTPGQLDSEQLSADKLKHALIEDFDISEQMVEQWAASGALEPSLQPSDQFKPPPFTMQPPSMQS